MRQFQDFMKQPQTSSHGQFVQGRIRPQSFSPVFHAVSNRGKREGSFAPRLYGGTHFRGKRLERTLRPKMSFPASHILHVVKEEKKRTTKLKVSWPKVKKWSIAGIFFIIFGLLKQAIQFLQQMCIQYAVLGFEPMTSLTRFFSYSH